MDNELASKLTELVERQLRLVTAIKALVAESSGTGSPAGVETWLELADRFQGEALELLCVLPTIPSQAHH